MELNSREAIYRLDIVKRPGEESLLPFAMLPFRMEISSSYGNASVFERSYISCKNTVMNVESYIPNYSILFHISSKSKNS